VPRWYWVCGPQAAANPTPPPGLNAGHPVRGYGLTGSHVAGRNAAAGQAGERHKSLPLNGLGSCGPGVGPERCPLPPGWHGRTHLGLVLAAPSPQVMPLKRANPAPAKLAGRRVGVPPVELRCSRRKAPSRGWVCSRLSPVAEGHVPAPISGLLLQADGGKSHHEHPSRRTFRLARVIRRQSPGWSQAAPQPGDRTRAR
jgi:hypothetical protein